ncbi:prepilin peptidase CpaA [Halodesulfovibrio aestuarii]|nr:prepilin peptidase CpaA [Halodesulfovibrio aestuarii]
MDILLIGIVVICALFDLRSQIIPNVIVLPAILIFWGAHYAFDGMSGLNASMTGTGLAFLFFFIPYKLGVLGAGDVKLFMAVGACLGPKGTVTTFLFTSLAGGLYALIVLIRHKNALRRFFNKLFGWAVVSLGTRKLNLFPEDAEYQMPMLCYGVAIAAGTLTTVMLSHLYPNLLILNILEGLS